MEPERSLRVATDFDVHILRYFDAPPEKVDVNYLSWSITFRFLLAGAGLMIITLKTNYSDNYVIEKFIFTISIVFFKAVLPS